MKLPLVALHAVLLAITTSTPSEAQSSPGGLRKTHWTVAEVKEWSAGVRGKLSSGLLLYQGSDTASHHFISRYMDDWVWFIIKRTELAISEEHPFKNTSSAPFGYYYVDPDRQFKRVKDY